ncbi:MAG: DUF1501 domain-containing protein [Saprospiraceae bacterium]|nr:DUF1501 domain-containing protein [Saprospiraceae bacterium]MDW8229362.1 DUF1501 domain-containing protein [Saprospiraceae bacterium]
MKRRSFIKNIAAGVALPSLLNGFGVRLHAAPLTRLLAPLNADNGRALVLIQLDGGNDGLATVSPLDQYDRLKKARPKIALPENSLLPLTGLSTLAMHPAFVGMRNLYEEGQVRIVQNVGYPNPNLSHFRATDIWMSGSDANEFISSGWAGRYLAYEYPNFPVGYPNATMPHPLAVEIGYSMSLTVMGPQTGMGFVIPNTDAYYQLLSGQQTPAPDTPAGEQLAYVRLIAQQSRVYAQAILDASKKANNLAIYPDTPLAAKLKIIARLIAGGLKTRLYLVSIGGFDTHAQQADPSDPTKGAHANLLRQLGDAVWAFCQDVQALGVADRVAGMTFSEFGRRIVSNFSDGTDHGESAPVFLFGAPVAGGVTGNNPKLPPNPTVYDNLDMEVDFRSVYATLLRDWFCVPEANVPGILLHKRPFLSGLFRPGVACATSSVHEDNQEAGRTLLSCWPNPFRHTLHLEYESTGAPTLVQVLDASGRVVATPVSGWQPQGRYREAWDAAAVTPGTYFCRLISGQMQQTRTVVKQ